MVMATRYKCPYCGENSTLNDETFRSQNFEIGAFGIYPNISLGYTQIVCSNDECQKSSFYIKLTRCYYTRDPEHTTFSIPSGNPIAPILPEYIPSAICEDFNEAHAVKNLSPKASATLARRCLQTMIRNFWNVKEKTLSQEINAIKNKIDLDTWEAIDAIRSIGNIGAHMEKDINIIVDVEPDEAQLLLDMIEQLVQEWYVTRETKRIRLEKMKAIGDEKQAARKGGSQITQTETENPA